MADPKLTTRQQQIFRPDALELHSRSGFDFVSQDYKSSQVEFISEIVSQRGVDLVRLTCALNRLAELEQAVQSAVAALDLSGPRWPRLKPTERRDIRDA